MSIGFTGDGQSPKSQKPQKPPRQRGYKIKKVKTERYGKTYTSYEKVPRSGYGSAFLQLFTLFLAILVLFNVATGAGYTGYKSTVEILYGATETVGNLTQLFLTGLVSVAGFLGPVIEGLNDFLFDHEKANDDLLTTGTSGIFNGVKFFDQKYIYEKDGYTVVVVVLADGKFLGFAKNGDRVVYESNHPSFSVGDVVTTRWFFGYRLINETNDFKWKGVKETREAFTFDGVTQ